MPRHRVLPVLAALTLALVLVPRPAAAATGDFRVLVDADDNAGTGCTIATADGPFTGVERVLVTTVDLDSKTVTSVVVQECSGGSLGAPVAVTSPAAPPWPLAPGASSTPTVLETGLELPPPAAGTLRLGFASLLVGASGDALLSTTGSPGGNAIILDLGQAAGIPTVGTWGLLLLAALLSGAGVLVLRRRSSRVAAVLGVVLLVGGIGAAWAAFLPTPDGDASDWAGISPLATDPSGDAPSQVDILAAYGVAARAGAGAILVFRFDLTPNAPPLAEPDSFATDEDTVLSSVNVLADNGSGVDSDPDSDPLTVSAFDATSAEGAAVTVAANGDLTYDPTGASSLQALSAGDSIDDTFTYTIDDGNGASDTGTVTVTVSGVNDPPAVTGATFAIDENSPAATPVGAPIGFSDPEQASESFTYAITAGNTGGAFTIGAASGQITVANAAAVDFETTPSFSLTVQVTDNGSPPLSGTATVTVNLNDVNDAPVVTPATFSLPENSPAATVVGTVSTSDQDVPTQALSYAITAGNTAGAFTIGPATGQITVANASALDFETNPSFSLTVQVTDNGSPPLSGSATITVNLANANEPPVLADQGFSIAENSPNATVLGTLAFTDPDAGETYAWSITAGNTGGAFTIGATSGQITVANAAAVNFEATPSFSLTVQITDDGTPPLSDTATVTITVLDVNEPPSAAPDTYYTAGNTQLAAGGATPTALAAATAATNVLANDSDPDTVPAFNTLSVVAASGVATSKGGTVDIAANGSFVYTPPPGVDATIADPDTFTYALSDGTNTVAGTVSVVIEQMIWYVKNDEAAGGDGTSTTPFDTLAAAASSSSAGEILYVFTGDGTSVGQDQGVALLDGQHLIGQGVPLVATVNGTPLTLVTAGTRPRIANTNAGGDGVTVTASTANGDRNGMAVRGLTISGDRHAVAIAATDAASLDVGLTSCALAGGSGAGLVVDGTGTTGAVAVTDLAALTASAAGGGGGLVLDDVVFDADPATPTFDTVAGGALSVGSTSSPGDIQGDGLHLAAVRGDLQLDTLTIGNQSGTGLLVSTPDASFNPATGSGFRLQTTGGAITTASGEALHVVNAAIGTAFSNLSSASSPGAGLTLDGVAGSLTVSGGTTVTNPTLQGIAVTATSANATFSQSGTTQVTGTGTQRILVDTSTGTVAFGNTQVTGGTDGISLQNNSAGVRTFGTLAVTGGSGSGVVVNGNSGGSTTFSGSTKTISTPGHPGVTLTGNTGHTMSFTGGGLAVTSTTAAGFTASGGGTVIVTGTGNTVTATTGAAVSITGTTIGASGVTFESLSSSGGTTPGLTLTNTGTTGPFSVTGDGAAAANGTGGTIANTTGNVDGVMLSNAANVTLARMNINNNSRNGVYGSNVAGLTLSYCSLAGNADQVSPDEAGILLEEATGAVTLTGTTVSNSFENNIKVANTLATPLTMTVAGSTLQNSGASTVAGHDLLFSGAATADMTLNVSGSTFTGSITPGALTANGILADTAGGTMSVEVTSSTFQSNNVGVGVSASGAGSMTFNIHDNPVITSSRSNAINVFTNASHTGTMSGHIENNVIGSSGVTGSGCLLGEGVRISNEGTGTTTVLVTGNTIREIGDGTGSGFEGVYVNEAVGGGTTNATITNNTLDQIRDDRGINCQVIIAGATLCSDIANNTLTNIYSPTPIRVRQTAGTHNVRQLDPAGSADPNRLDTINGGVAVSVAGTINFNAGACPQP